MVGIGAAVTGLFDYAGMFPPAALSFEAALKESAGFPDALRRPQMVANDMVLTPEHWRRLDDAAFAAAGFTRPCRVCIVGVDVREAPDVAREVLEWNQDGGTARPARQVTSLEVHFEDVLETPTRVAGHITKLRHIIGGRIQLYIEPKWEDAEWNVRLDRLWGLLDTLNDDVELPPVGLKFRCAGATALTPDTVARIIAGMDERALPLKATQGLHHPFATPEAPIGFLGLVTAIRLHDAIGMSHDDTVQCLTETEAGAFEFADGVAWRGQGANRDAMASGRVPLSIGSCSIAEPDADLAALFP